MLFLGLIVMFVDVFWVLAFVSHAPLLTGIRRFRCFSFFGSTGMMLFAADYLGRTMRRLAGELHQLFGFAPEFGGLLRELSAEPGRGLGILRLQLRNFRECFLARGFTLARVAECGFQVGGQLFTLIAQRLELRRQFCARGFGLALDALLQLARLDFA